MIMTFFQSEDIAHDECHQSQHNSRTAQASSLSLCVDWVVESGEERPKEERNTIHDTDRTVIMTFFESEHIGHDVAGSPHIQERLNNTRRGRRRKRRKEKVIAKQNNKTEATIDAGLVKVD